MPSDNPLAEVNNCFSFGSGSVAALSSGDSDKLSLLLDPLEVNYCFELDTSLVSFDTDLGSGSVPVLSGGDSNNLNLSFDSFLTEFLVFGNGVS